MINSNRLARVDPSSLLSSWSLLQILQKRFSKR